jgi:hypothetical protein
MVDYDIDLDHDILMNSTSILAEKSRRSDRVIREPIGIKLHGRNLNREQGGRDLAEKIVEASHPVREGEEEEVPLQGQTTYFLLYPGPRWTNRGTSIFPSAGTLSGAVVFPILSLNFAAVGRNIQAP